MHIYALERFSYLEGEIFQIFFVEFPIIQTISWIFCLSTEITTMASKYTTESRFLSFLYTMRAIPFDLCSFSISKPNHLLFLSLLRSSINITDLKKSNITTFLVAPFRLCIELTLMIHECDCCDNSITIFENFLHQFHLVFAWEKNILHILSYQASTIFNWFVFWLHKFICLCVLACNDDRIALKLEWLLCFQVLWSCEHNEKHCEHERYDLRFHRLKIIDWYLYQVVPSRDQEFARVFFACLVSRFFFLMFRSCGLSWDRLIHRSLIFLQLTGVRVMHELVHHGAISYS